MSSNLYISGLQSRSGKSLVALGMMEQLSRKLQRVAFFKPIIHLDPGHQDKDLQLIRSRYLETTTIESMFAYSADQASQLLAAGKQEELLEGILSRYTRLSEENDFVLCLGSDLEGVAPSLEFDFNAEIALNLAAPMLLVSNVKDQTSQEILDSFKGALESYRHKGCEIVSLILNQCNLATQEGFLYPLIEDLQTEVDLVFTIEDQPGLSAASVSEVVHHLGAKVLFGSDQQHRQIEHYEVAGTQLRHFLPQLKENSLIITPGDRLDLILGALVSFKSKSMPHPAGIVLTEGIFPEGCLDQVIEGMGSMPPILFTQEGTYETASKLNKIHTGITQDNQPKVAAALGHFESQVDAEALTQKIVSSCPRAVTPKMFEFNLIQKAAKNKQHIVLPEGTDERILKAAEILLKRKVAKFTLLGEPKLVQARIDKLGVQLEGATIVDPKSSPLFEEYCQEFMGIRAHKNPTLEQAKDIMCDVSYFGTMMVHLGHADGMVSGAAHSTMHTIRPSFELIKTKPGCNLVSSVFFMCLADRVLVYGDCAVNPNPNPEELCEIALCSSETAQAFGIKPKVAMLSYSSGDSGKGEDVELVRQAVQLAQAKRPNADIEGPIQYDAAVDFQVGKAKMPESTVAGQANVFIFPDLNTGNNTYKAVQRSANAVAIGPILQGLNKPINDLSRGCLVEDIINTIAITCIQAQQVSEQSTNAPVNS